jgi:hypothetical protein
VRAGVLAFLRKRMTVVYAAHGTQTQWRGGQPGGPRTVDGDYVDVTDRTDGDADAAIPEMRPRRPGQRPSGWSTGGKGDN